MRRFLFVLLGALALASFRPEAALAQPAIAVVVADLNLRAGPSTRYHSLAVIPAGAPVNVLSCSSGWCRISIDGIVGYVSERYLSFAGYAAAPSYAPPTVYSYEYYRPHRYYDDHRRTQRRYVKPRYNGKYDRKKFSYKKDHHDWKKFDRKKLGRKDFDRKKFDFGKKFRSRSRPGDQGFSGRNSFKGRNFKHKGRSGESGKYWKKSSLTAPGADAAYVGDRRIMWI